MNRPYSELLPVLPTTTDPDPTSSSWFPIARDPMGMGRWTSRPMAWNPNPIPSPMFPVPGSPNGIWIGGAIHNIPPEVRVV